jgi:hypothetical protein
LAFTIIVQWIGDLTASRKGVVIELSQDCLDIVHPAPAGSWVEANARAGGDDNSETLTPETDFVSTWAPKDKADDQSLENREVLLPLSGPVAEGAE